jgi:hypothetical protein
MSSPPSRLSVSLAHLKARSHPAALEGDMRLVPVFLSVALAFTSIVLLPHLARACSGCGCRGGPGYRGPDGRCVGFAALNHVCGTPPETRCTREAAAQVEEPNCSGCGCKGGPGYRAKDGHCVGYQEIRQVCGDPPTLHCAAELTPLGGVPKASSEQIGK